MSDSVTLSVASRLDEVERVSRDVDAFGRSHSIPAEIVFDANLVLDEVLTNIVSYAYDDDAEHEIVVRLRIEDGAVVIETEDDGRPFDPLAAAEPDLALPASERSIGGLGLSLVRRLTEALSYERRAAHNVFTMRFRTQVRDAAGEIRRHDFTHDGGLAVLIPDERLDKAGSAEFEPQLLGAIAAGARRLVVDCSDIDYINSAGLRLLLVAAKRVTASGGSFFVVAPRGQIRHVVEMAGFESAFPVCSTLAEAIGKSGTGTQ